MDLFFLISLLLLMATGLSYVMHRLKQPLILAHLVTGVIAGPMALNVFHGLEAFELLSKIGITSLLFIVGLSLSPKVVREVGKTSLIVGTGQILFTSLFGFFIILAFGWSFVPALLIAIGLTFSSTIIVLKILQDKKDLNSLYGRLATGTMLVQDLAATIVLIILAAVGVGNGGDTLGQLIIATFLKGALLILSLVFFSKHLLPTLTKTFASSQEFLLLFSVAWGVGVAGMFKLLGFSIEVGALAAGMSLATSPYHYEISSKMKILRDFFLVLFFVTLGATLSFTGIEKLIAPSIILSLFVLIGNPFILFMLLRVLGYAPKPSFQTGITMAQVSEFSLVVLLLARSMNLVGDDAVVLVTICAMITIALSSYLMIFDEWLYAVLYRFFAGKPVEKQKRMIQHENHEAILFGCHRLGEDFLPYLKNYKHGIVVDFDPNAVDRLIKSGVDARYGDAEDNEFLDELGLEKTKLIITTIPDTDAILFILSKLRKINKKCIFIAMAHSPEEAKTLYQKGANYIILPHYLGGNYAALLIEKFGLNASKFDQEKEKHLKHLNDRIERQSYAKRAV